MKKRQKKRYITLIELMVVIAIIGIISGVLAYNLRGSLEEGKAFKTQEGSKQLAHILELEAATRASEEEVLEQWEEVVRHSPYVNDPRDLLNDGWGKSFNVSLDNNGRFIVSSERYAKYKERRG
ncbi:type II secretion system protein [Simkania negevensis]|uniref:Type II secretion system protein n=1 Tax=Simkania negevensis TaxID=83561 RepID=A0ABS3AUD5_9BACT|nr:type II secretion system protein [Simkania negevensis]